MAIPDCMICYQKILGDVEFGGIYHRPTRYDQHQKYIFCSRDCQIKFEQCVQCSNPIPNDQSFNLEIWNDRGTKFHFAYFCSKECRDIRIKQKTDTFCKLCSKGTSDYLCETCTVHQENIDSEVVCTICNDPYNEYFKKDDCLDQYLCSTCFDTVERYRDHKRWSSTRSIIKRYKELKREQKNNS